MKHTINPTVLRALETLPADIARARANGQEFMASCFETLLQSKASNDLIERLAIESIGAICSGKKLGADGFLSNGMGVEAKPHKGKSSTAKGGVINDDTPTKLKRDFHEVSTIIFTNAAETGDRINWQIVAPFHYWTPCRFAKVCKRLNLDWKWPTEKDAQISTLDALLAEHKESTYVRSNSLSLGLLKDIPIDEITIWIHPDLADKQLPKILKTLRTRTSAPLTA